MPFAPLATGDAHEGLARIAAGHGATVHQVAIGWGLALSPTTLAIPGRGSISYLEQNVAAQSIALTRADLDELDSDW
ncbi:aldo/keto reductase [Glaciihabitans sp. UYNi722]|uniref:aldo/keto reductase n=1 Tax=Glaciihabitans sp. UYNi722 TaxID=3156344 RepID=UPI0033915FC8